MPTYRVLRKSDNKTVYAYTADAPVEFPELPFAEFDHIAEVNVNQDGSIPADTSWGIYPGPFKDRLGVDGLAIAASSHPVCAAVREMLYDRKYVDLKGEKVSILLDMLIATGQPEASPYFPGSSPMTPAKKAVILDTPPTAEERYTG